MVSPAGPISDLTETAARYPAFRAFLSELRRVGFVEGRNLTVERYSADGHPERYAQIVADVVRGNPDAVLIYTVSLVQEFKAQTKTIPIVYYGVDPVILGLASSIAHPGGNFTGVYVAGDTWGKRLALLKETIPTVSRVGFLVARTSIAEYGGAMLKDAAEKQGISLVGSPLESPFDAAAYRRAFANIAEKGAQAVYVADQAESFVNRALIVELAEQYRLPAIYPDIEAPTIGGLMAYATNLVDAFRTAADMVADILNGTKPGEIPFQHAPKFDLIINLKTARALGIEISPNLLARADEVIE
jgi:putative ABC transport system substrate-binding protein